VCLPRNQVVYQFDDARALTDSPHENRSWNAATVILHSNEESNFQQKFKDPRKLAEPFLSSQFAE
jgi:hypothetical protein